MPKSFSPGTCVCVVYQLLLLYYLERSRWKVLRLYVASPFQVLDSERAYFCPVSFTLEPRPDFT